jgi:hypothetical protein
MDDHDRAGITQPTPGGASMTTECPNADRGIPKPEEVWTRRILEPVLGCKLIYIDAPDFVICRKGEVVGCVEVTTATDEAARRLQARLSTDGRAFTVEGLDSSWVVRVKRDTDGRKLDRNEIGKVLLDLEHDGADASTLNTGARQQLADLGITHAFRGNSLTNSPRVHLVEPGFAAYVDPTAINSLVSRKSKTKKAVLLSGPPPRNLFIWVDPFEPHGAGLAIGGTPSELPDEPAELPTWLDTVWMMSTYAPPKLWQCDRDLGWRVHDVDILDLPVDPT